MKTKVFCWGNTHSPFIREQIETLKDAGYEVHWYWHKAVENFYFEDFIQLPRWIGASIVLRFFLEPIYVWLLLRRLQPSLVHVFFGMKALGVYALRGRRVIVSVMGSEIEQEAGYKVFFAFFTRQMLTVANKILIKSEFMFNRIVAINPLWESKVMQLAWGVDVNEFTKVEDIAGREGDDSLVFFDPRVARHFYNKEQIITAFGRYIARTGRKQDRLLVSEYMGEKNIWKN